MHNIETFMICICIYNMSSSCCVASWDVLDPLSSFVPFIHRFWLVIRLYLVSALTCSR